MSKIPSNRPFFPPREEFDELLDGIWKREWITNQGELVTELERQMAEFLDVQHTSFVSSGTMGLQLTLKTLPRRGEIITTPFSYPATANAIVQEGFTPVFADILPGELTLNPELIKPLISTRTVGIMPVHVYGNNCHVDAFAEISRALKVPVIYDAAHSFGARTSGESIFKSGDFSVLSTHATKMFHTANGGFVISKSADDRTRIEKLRNFGHNGPNTFDLAGINGKNSELHAAMGLCNLKHVDSILKTRKTQWNYYRDKLAGNRKLELLTILDPSGYNASYFPVIFEDTALCDRAFEEGECHGIAFRKYFSPSLNQLKYVRYQPCPVSESISSRTLCLPLFHELKQEEQDRVIALINSL